MNRFPQPKKLQLNTFAGKILSLTLSEVGCITFQTKMESLFGGDIREDSRRQKVQERVNRGNALRSWIAIIISLIALLSSFRSEIAWLWMQLTQ